MIPVDGTWRGFGGLHGGLVVAWVLSEADVPSAMSASAVSVAFWRPLDPEVPVAVETEQAHVGRTTATSIVRLLQGGRACAHGVVSAGTRADGPAAWDPAVDLAALATPLSRTRFLPPPEVVAFARHVDIRPLTPTLPGSGATEPRYEAWVRLVDPDITGALGPAGTAAVLLDAMPPGLFALWRQPRPVPTVELTAHLAAATVDPGGWHHIRHETVWADGATCLDQTELRGPDGRLVARACQTRRIVGAPAEVQAVS